MVSTASTQPSLDDQGGKTPPPPSPIPDRHAGKAPTPLSPTIDENPFPLSTMRVVVNMEIAVTPGKTPPPPTHRIEILVTPPAMPEA